MHLNRQPAPRGLFYLRVFDAEEAGDGGAGEVDVEDADGVACEGEGECELGCYGGFADAAFAGEDLGWGGGGVSGWGLWVVVGGEGRAGGGNGAGWGVRRGGNY